MKKLAFTLVAALAVPSFAADYKCNGNAVEKSGSTQYTVRQSGSEITIEKSGSTKGRAVKSGSKFTVEVSGSTVATFENGKIEKSGGSWGTVSDAQHVFDCSGDVAATLWILQKNGNL